MSSLFSRRCAFVIAAASSLLAGCATIFPDSPPGSAFFKEIVVRGGYGNLSDKAPTWGVTVGAETPLQKASKKIDFYSVEVDVPIKGTLGDWQTQMELKANWGSESTGLESAAGSRGQAFQGGFNGGTGGFASNAPSSTHVETKYNEQSVTFAAQSPLLWFNQSDQSKITKEMLLTFDRIARKYDSMFGYPAIPGLAGIDDQRVRTLNFGAGFGAFGTHRFDNGVSASLGGRINLNVVSGHYSGTHRYTNPLAAPVNQDFTQTTWNNGGCDLTWSGRAFGELGYRPDRRTEWLARFAYNYLGNGFALRNKVTPDDPTPYLVNAGLGSWNATLGVRYEW